MLLTFQTVAALPLHAPGQRHDGQPCRQPDHLEGIYEGDQQHDHQTDHQIDRQPDEPPPGLGTDQPPTQPPQLPPSQPSIAQPPEATVTIIESLKSYVWGFPGLMPLLISFLHS